MEIEDGPGHFRTRFNKAHARYSPHQKPGEGPFLVWVDSDLKKTGYYSLYLLKPFKQVELCYVGFGYPSIKWLL